MNIEVILAEGEGYHIKFKESLSKIDKELVAFANASGGRVFLGVSGKSEIKGFKLTNSIKSEIQSIAQNCDPPIKIELEEIGNITIIHIPEGTRKPHRCSSGFYLRNGATSQKLRTDEIINFIQREQRYNFDEQINDRYPANDFDREKYLEFIRKCNISENYNPKEVILNLGMAEIVNSNFVLNNTGILFIGNHPERYLLHSVVTCVLYKGTEKITILDRKDYNSDIISNIENAVVFLKRHLNVRYEIKTVRRKEILELPETALREAIVNAVTHRDYFQRGANVLVELFSDRLEITNPGGLPAGMEISDLGKKSITRNPLIAAILLRANYIEKLGTGIKRIQKALNEAGHCKAVFEIDRFFTIIFRLEYSKSDEPVNGTVIGTVNGTENGTEKMLLKEIRSNPGGTLDEYGVKINRGRRTVARYIKKLKEINLIRRIGSDKTGYWEVLDEKDKRPASK